MEVQTESNTPKQSHTPTGSIMLATGLALGLAATAWLINRRHKNKVAWDPERILDACDTAAARLDEILYQETRQVG